MKRVLNVFSVRSICGLILLFAFGAWPARCQEAAPSAAKQAAKTPEPSDKQPELPAQIELLETRVRFEANGDSRKEVHTRVHINNELGARQFARLTFDYNRSFQQIEFPLVRITHSGGGTVDILPSAIADQPSPAVVNAPAYQDVRVKSVRILGLAPGDILEYRVVTTTSHAPLAPNIWLWHSFDRSGVVSQEAFDVELPASRVDVALHVRPTSDLTSKEAVGSGDSARVIYHWNWKASSHAENSENLEPDVAFSSFSWESLSVKLAEKLLPGAVPLEDLQTLEADQKEIFRKPEITIDVKTKALELTKQASTVEEKLKAIYEFVSQKIATVDLALGSTGFSVRSASEVLSSRYATAEDKFVLFSALTGALGLRARAAMAGYCNRNGVPRPSVFTHLLISAGNSKATFWLDPSLEVAPFAVISTPAKGCVFVLEREFHVANSTGHEWQTISPHLPFASFQHVRVEASLAPEGALNAKVHYAMRGENELLLRVTFHKAPKEKWKEVAQLLALSDGFRGKITNVTASDPYATKGAFTVEYEISQPKFVDWSKKPVRIPALLPQLGLPDQATKPATGAAKSAIDLGTPLDVETHLTLHLPAGTSVRTPTGTSVERDYATFMSKYAARGATVTATRHLNFLLREVSGDRAADYNAFVRAVQGDEAQEFALERDSVASAQPRADKPTKKN
jgi:Domain of Unknown Function with PDB structure (DUF3857)/Transglutaminase-like superfamily